MSANAPEYARTADAEGGYLPAAETVTADVTVLMGGPSREHEVSLMSGRAVAEALGRCGHRVTTADISPQDTSALDREGLEIVFVALHGAFGEDGQVQRLCQQRNLPYVGSGPAASCLAMDKHLSKTVFRRVGLTTPDWVVIERSMPPPRRRALLAEVPPPCVLKPIDGGSSVDVTIAGDESARHDALEQLLEVYGLALIETFIPGREMTVGILGERPLPIIEVRPNRQYYDYVAKYQDDATGYLVNPDIPPAIGQHLRGAAITAHRALGCRDLSRVDFILGHDGRAYVLEANTIPGFTSHSLVPKAAAAAGISFEQLCDRLLRLALARAGR